MKVGEKRTFNFDKGKTYEIKEIIDRPNLSVEWEWKYMVCPYCQKQIKETKIHTITAIEVLENEDGDIETLGYTTDNKYMRLPNKRFSPEKDMSVAIKAKSKYLKEKIEKALP